MVATSDRRDVGEPPSYTASTEHTMRMSDAIGTNSVTYKIHWNHILVDAQVIPV